MFPLTCGYSPTVTTKKKKKIFFLKYEESINLPTQMHGSPVRTHMWHSYYKVSDRTVSGTSETELLHAEPKPGEVERDVLCAPSAFGIQ